MWACVFLVCVAGVFGVGADEVTSVMEGNSVTLHTGLKHIQIHDRLLWIFEFADTLIAEIHAQNVSIFNKEGIFKDRLEMNNQTGSLTITNITTEHSGLYQLRISRNMISDISFNLIVYAHLPPPVIIRNSSQCSSSSERSSVSKCVLLCSVMNVTHVSLSWYKGNSLLSSISVSDLNIILSLPLEVEYQDTNTYRCVVNNTISNHTQHLDINKLCGSCSAFMQKPHWVGITVFLVMLVVATAALSVMFLLYSRKTRTVQTHDEEEIHYADTTFSARHSEIPKDAHTLYSSVPLS
ncbi:uncharacterized protein LOC130429891 [Triplophysa dalaica]|uniref:uncharacterized protein LOC130429891 n=1 Tax=Triplophysa dalaica TaxID=1582913 RepID=UPI0024DFB014|nr:uncharacterized protein LOC130429891 [Triplophysa dalaica]